LQVKTLFYQILLSIYQQLCSQESYVKQTGLVSKIKAYVEEHYTELIRLESLAERLNYSVSHISAVFKSETNYSLVEYVMQLRMKKAVALLKSTNVPLKEIAASVGYTDVHYFNRLFKRHLGISPGRYRKLVLDRGMLADAPQNIIESSIDKKHSNDILIVIIIIDMARKNKSNFAATLLLCLTLLLGACASGANTNSGPKGI